MRGLLHFRARVRGRKGESDAAHQRDIHQIVACIGDMFRAGSIRCAR